MAQPFFVRRLTRSERITIRKFRKRPPNLDVYRRAQAVHFSSQGLGVLTIAEMVSCNRSTVFRWLQAFNHHGMDALWPGKSPGRPPKADAEFQAALIDAVEKNPHDLGYAFTRWTAAHLSEHLQKVTHIRVSPGTIYHRCCQLPIPR